MKRPNHEHIKGASGRRILTYEGIEDLLQDLEALYETARRRIPITDFRGQQESDKAYKDIRRFLDRVQKYQRRYK